MKLRGGVEWALHICTLLAALPDDAVLHREQLAVFYELPSTYLAKQLQQLAQAGIVRPNYGAGGGYGLGRPANQITVLDVVEAIDGDQASFTCTEIRRNGPTGVPEGAYSVPCTIAVVMGRADAAWRGELRRHTVADLAASLSHAVPPAQRRLAREWLRQNLRSRAPATP